MHLKKHLSKAVTCIVVLVLFLLSSGSGGQKRDQRRLLKGGQENDIHLWTDDEIDILRSLWIESLPPLPPDPSNRYSASPKAARLGERLFFDPRFSSNGVIACASCHHSDLGLTDEYPVARGAGEATRRTMTLIGVGYNSWFFWDGRKDSLWSQALAPIENPAEHGISRTKCVLLLIENYRREYEDLFGPLPDLSDSDCPAHARPSSDNPDAAKAWEAIPHEKRTAINRVYANMGKAMGAYMRLFLPAASRFDRYVEAILKGDLKRAGTYLTDGEIAGLNLFIGKGKCIKCHNGPLLTDGGFHNLGFEQIEGLPPDRGRADGLIKIRNDEFNCRGKYSDAGPDDCEEVSTVHIPVEKFIGAMKTPTLRNVAERPPYMHAGQFKTLGEVLNFYRNNIPDRFKTSNLEHGDLSSEEILRIEAFLEALTGPLTIPHFR